MADFKIDVDTTKIATKTDIANLQTSAQVDTKISANNNNNLAPQFKTLNDNVALKQNKLTNTINAGIGISINDTSGLITNTQIPCGNWVNVGTLNPNINMIEFNFVNGRQYRAKYNFVDSSQNYKLNTASSHYFDYFDEVDIGSMSFTLLIIESDYKDDTNFKTEIVMHLTNNKGTSIQLVNNAENPVLPKGYLTKLEELQ